MAKFVQYFAATPQNIDRNNRWFVFILAGGLGVLGSVISIMVSSAFLLIFVLQLSGIVRKSDHPDMWKIALLFLTYFLVTSVLSLVHFDEGKNLNVIVENLAFLAFFPLVMALSYSPREAVRQHLETGAALGSVLALVVILIELSTGTTRPEGASGNSGPFALSISLAYAICLLGLFRANSRIRAALMLAGIMAAFICVLASGIRAMWPALLLLIIVAGWGCGFGELRRRWKVYLIGVVVASLAAYLMIGDIIVQRVELVFRSLEQITVLGQYNSSLGERLIMWKFAWISLPDAIWIGLGEEKALTGLDKFAIQQLGYSNAWNHFHNFVVNAVMRGGILELSATLALLFGPLVIAWKHNKDEISRYGIAFMIAIVLIFVESGTLGITFGHDIMDHLYTYMMAVATWLTIGGDNVKSADVKTR